MTTVVHLPRTMRIGAGASRQLPELLAELGLSRPLLVTDPHMVACGYVDRVTEPLRAAGITGAVFDRCVPDPTTDAIADGMAVFTGGDFDALVALGGGSAIDTAKAMAVLGRHGGAMADYKVPHTVPSGLPVIAIPTTAGTGSEATRVAVVTDSDSGEKMLCMGPGLMPTAALVDFELTLTMPFRLTADTGIDSLCHAMEAYVSRKANPFADQAALAAMTAIPRHLPAACADPDNRAAREAMMLAATQGGIAFSNASVTLIHGMSRPLGAFFHVPHGMSNGMLMAAVTEYSIDGNRNRYADCARVMGFAEEGDDDGAAAVKLVDNLYRLCEALAVPTPSSFGIDKEHYFAVLGNMAAQALASGSPANNPVKPSAEEIEGLYRKIWA